MYSHHDQIRSWRALIFPEVTCSAGIKGTGNHQIILQEHQFSLHAAKRKGVLVNGSFAIYKSVVTYVTYRFIALHHFTVHYGINKPPNKLQIQPTTAPPPLPEGGGAWPGRPGATGPTGPMAARRIKMLWTLTD